MLPLRRAHQILRRALRGIGEIPQSREQTVVEIAAIAAVKQGLANYGPEQGASLFHRALPETVGFQK